MLNFKSLKIGDKVIQAAHAKPGSCVVLLGRPTCNHKACWQDEQTYTVKSFRKAPKGQRVNLTLDGSPYGGWTAIRCDADGNFPAGWSKK